jgi:aspartate dehydrogenase
MPETVAPQAALHTVRAGAGPTLLLLHGIGSSATSWQRQIARLAGDYALIAPDLRGYGDSPDPTGAPSLDAVADDLAALLSGAPAHVIGVSFGALAALALARRHPGLVRSLVLSDTTLGRASLTPEERARWVEGRYALAAGLQIRADERAREIAGPGAADDVLAEIASNMRRARPAGYRYVTDIIAATDALPWLEHVAVPALVVCGEHDSVVGLPLSATIAERIPDARLATIPGAGHAPNVERPDDFAGAVRAFVDGVEMPSRVVRVALAGAGAIATVLIDGIARGSGGMARVTAIGRLEDQAGAVDVRARRQSAAAFADLERLPDHASLVIEAAGPAVVRRYAAGWLARGADVMVLSAGALVDPVLARELHAVARAHERRILVPSGAVAGIDGIRAGALGGMRTLSLRTTKPPRGLAGAPYVVANAIDLDALTVPTTIFEGTVADAVRGFPSNVNVAAVLALAGAGIDVRVSVVADPTSTTNVHEIEASGEFGTFTVRLDNLPSPENPKTSALAPLSALAMLRRLSQSLWVGA